MALTFAIFFLNRILGAAVRLADSVRRLVRSAQMLGGRARALS